MPTVIRGFFGTFDVLRSWTSRRHWSIGIIRVSASRNGSTILSYSWARGYTYTGDTRMR